METTTTKMKDFQEDAVREAVMKGKKGVILQGDTGSGKTKTSLEIAKRWAECGDTKRRPWTLVVTKSMGGSMLDQWKRETYSAGVPKDATCVFHGSDRDERLRDWWFTDVDGDANANANANADASTSLMVCITTPEIIQNAYKSGPCDSLLFGIPWGVVISDEAHMWRNGSPRRDSREVDADRRRYAAINCLIQMQNPKVILVTATLMINNVFDVYSQGRLIPGVFQKSAWLNKEVDTGAWEMEKRKLDDIIVSIKMPSIMGSGKDVVDTIKYSITPREEELMERNHYELRRAASGMLMRRRKRI